MLHGRARQLFLDSVPPDLKRFSEARRTSKLSTFVNFPMKDLDLREFSSENSSKEKQLIPAWRAAPAGASWTCPHFCPSLVAANAVYNLYAVSNHSGTTMGGHYTAYCRNPSAGEWYTFNDSRYLLPLSRSHNLWVRRPRDL